MKNFYSAKEAQERLGITDNNFYYLVRKGTIKKVTMPGKKQSVYPKSDVDKLASALKTLIDQYDRETSIFEAAGINDMQEEYQMDVSLYGRKTATVEQRITRLEKNPESDYVLKNQGEIVGHISFFPVDQETLTKFLNGEISDPELPDKVLPFTSGEPLNIIILVMGVKPGFPPDVASHYGQRLIAGTINVLKQLGERGVVIDKFYATSRTPTGIKLCRKLGMNEEQVPNEVGRFRFSLDAQASSSPLISEYQAGLAEYKKTRGRKRRSNPRIVSIEPQ